MAMASGAEEFERLKAEVFSIALSVGNVVYISIEQLESDYIDLNGRPIAYADFNFPTLRDMLAAMSDKIMLMDYDGQGTAVIPISNARTKHLERLIEKQNQKQDEPTRFGGVVAGLDNKEQNRARNAARSFTGKFAAPANQDARSRSEGPRTTPPSAPTTPATSGILENQNTRPMSIIEMLMTRPPPPLPAPTVQSREMPAVQIIREICPPTVAVRPPCCPTAQPAVRSKTLMQIHKIPKSVATHSVRAAAAMVQSRNTQILKAEEDRLKYSRDLMLELRKSEQKVVRPATGICSLYADPVVTGWSGSKVSQNELQTAAGRALLASNELDQQEQIQKDYPDMDFVEFVVRNIIDLLINYPKGLSIRELKYVYQLYFPSEPITVLESFGLSLEEFFECNMKNELVVRSKDGVAMVQIRECEKQTLLEAAASVVVPNPFDSAYEGESFRRNLHNPVVATTTTTQEINNNLHKTCRSPSPVEDFDIASACATNSRVIANQFDLYSSVDQPSRLETIHNLPAKKMDDVEAWFEQLDEDPMMTSSLMDDAPVVVDRMTSSSLIDDPFDFHDFHETLRAEKLYDDAEPEVYDIPPQPRELLPPGKSVPDELRRQIYNLLRSNFDQGVKLNPEFTTAFQKYYCKTILSDLECNMTLEQLFRCMADILDVGKDENGHFYVRPKDRTEVARMMALHRAPPQLTERSPGPKHFVPDPPPATCVASDVRLSVEKFLDPCGDRGLPFYNFRTIYEQPSLRVFLSLYGYQSFEQFFTSCVQHQLVNVFENPANGDKLIRLKKYDRVLR